MKKFLRWLVVAIFFVAILWVGLDFIPVNKIRLRDYVLVITLICLIIAIWPIKQLSDDDLAKMLLKHSGHGLAVSLVIGIITLSSLVMFIAPYFLVDEYADEIIDFCDYYPAVIAKDLSKDFKEPLLIDLCLVQTSISMQKLVSNEIDSIPRFPESDSTRFKQLAKSCENLNLMIEDFESAVVTNNGDEILNNRALMDCYSIILEQYIPHDVLPFKTEIVSLVVYLLFVISITYILRYGNECVYITKHLSDLPNSEDV